MVYGDGKRRDIGRSVLPSTNREAARAARKRAHRHARRATAQLAGMARIDVAAADDANWAALDRRERVAISYMVGRRRGGDKLGPILRWGTATTRDLPVDERLPSLRRVLPDNLIGRHALSHLRPHPPINGGTRWQPPARPEVVSGELLAPWCALLLAEGRHGEFNRAIKDATATATTRGWERLLLGAHDIDGFVADLLAHGITRPPPHNRPEPPHIVVVRAWLRFAGFPRGPPVAARPIAARALAFRICEAGASAPWGCPGSVFAMLRSRQVSLGGVIWLVVGVIVASSHHFLAHLQTVSEIGSAILAVLVWPLVLLHVHLAI